MDQWKKVLPLLQGQIEGIEEDKKSTIKVAFYTGAVHFLFVLAACALVGLYYVFEMFLRPLLWAVLLGGFLYPIKKMIVETIDRWLKNLEDSHTTLPHGALRVVVELPERMVAFFWVRPERWLGVVGTMIAASGIVTLDDFVLAVVFCVNLGLEISSKFLEGVYLVVQYAQAPVVEYLYRGVAIGTLLTLLGGTLCWALLTRHHNVSRFTIGVFYATLIVYGYPLALELLGSDVLLVLLVLMIGICVIGAFQGEQSFQLTPSVKEIMKHVVEPPTSPYRGRTWRARSTSQPPKKIPRAATIASLSLDDDALDKSSSGKTPPPTPVKRGRRRVFTKRRGDASTEGAESSSTEVCLILMISCFVVAFWDPLPWLIVTTLSMAAVMWAVRRIFRVKRVVKLIDENYDTAVFYLVPPPLSLVWSLVTSGDRFINQRIRVQLDAVTSLVLILGIVASTLLCLVFFAIQLKAESTTVAGSVWEQRGKVAHAWSSIAGEELHHYYEQTLNMTVAGMQTWVEKQFYEYTGEEIDFSQLESQLPTAWVLGASHLNLTTTTPVTSDELWSPQVEAVMSNILGVLPFVREHVNTLLFTVNTVAHQIAQNLRILWWVILAVLSQVHSVLNFLVSVILFLTTLFYLMTTSTAEGDYQPYNWILFMLRGEARQRVEQAINQTIEEVFESSFKIALFHGMLGWLTYTLFGCSFVYFTSLLMACLAVAPIIATYWLTIPAALELWLIANKPIHGVMLVLAHVGASWYIDPIIYAQIQQSHFYITGLSVVGGVYFLGLEGIVIGPMLLCGILVFGKLVTPWIE